MADSPMPEKLGRYTIVRELGKGAMGIVYEGKDPNIGRRVAIKTARRDVMEATGMAKEMMERFLREARAAGALNHPNIITIYDAGEEGDMAYIAMEFLEGGDLEDVVKEKKRLDCKLIVEIGAQICDALAVAHDEGVVHRDIKPANILMPERDKIKVADFGIAHVSDSSLTQDGALIGTPHYMSPEQFMGQKVDGRSDLFSVGNILYELITGEKPFSGEALSTVMHHVIKTTPVPPSELNFTIPDALSEAVMIALSKKPNDRYATGRDMAAALRESLKENPNQVVIKTGKQPNLDATIPGGAALGATVAGAPPAGLDTTQPGGAPAGLDATQPGGAPAGLDATQPGGGPADPEATMPGAPPAAATFPGAIPASTVNPAPDSATLTGAGSALHTAGKKPLPVPAIAGAAAAVLVLAGIAWSMLGGSGETAPSAAIDHPYFSSIAVKVYRAADSDTYTAYILGDTGPARIPDLIKDNKLNTLAVELLVTDPKNNQKTFFWSDRYIGDKVEIEDAPETISVQIKLAGETEAAEESLRSATQQGEHLELEPVVLPPGPTT